MDQNSVDSEKIPANRNEVLRVFYDGGCPVCYREVEHYRKLVAPAKVEWVDITSSEFNAASEGLDPREVHERMHSKRADSVFVGVDSFIEIWRLTPRYQWLIPIVSSSVLRPIFDFGYRVFAKQIRPRLPRRDCGCK